MPDQSGELATDFLRVASLLEDYRHGLDGELRRVNNNSNSVNPLRVRH